MLKRNLKGSITLSLDEFERERDEELAKKVRLFGTGADDPPTASTGSAPTRT